MAQQATRKTHRFHKGRRVYVFTTTMAGRFIIEGEATIVRPVRGVDEYYVVSFPDGQYQRFVDPEGQSDPGAHLDKLNSAAPSPS